MRWHRCHHCWYSWQVLVPRLLRSTRRCLVVVLILDESRGDDILAARPSLASVTGLAGRAVGFIFSSLDINQVAIKNIPLVDVRPLFDSSQIAGEIFDVSVVDPVFL